MCRKALFEKNFLRYASWISMQIKAILFFHISNVYSHTKLNTPVLVWSLQLSNFGLTHVTEYFSVTIDCVRFLIRRFPLFTYSLNIPQIVTKFWLHFFAKFDLWSTPLCDFICLWANMKSKLNQFWLNKNRATLFVVLYLIRGKSHITSLAWLSLSPVLIPLTLWLKKRGIKMMTMR